MESKESQSVAASENGKERVEPGRAVGTLDSKTHPVPGLSNEVSLGSASMESSGLAVGADLKATVNSLGSSNNQDFHMGGMPSQRSHAVQQSAIKKDLKIAVEPRCYDSLSDTDFSSTTEEESSASEMISTYMDPVLYRAATTGDFDAFVGAVCDAERMLIDNITPRGNSVLHLAASFGHDRIVNFILQKYPDIAELQNQQGDLALHVAASAGHLTVIKSLVSFTQNSARRGGPKPVGATLLRNMNQQGNTPLHVALENGQQKAALFLVQADPQVSYCLNRKGKSPFFMATKSGYLEIVKHITTKDPSRLDSYHQVKIAEQKCGFAKRDCIPPKKYTAYWHGHPKGCQLLHASIIGRNKDVMDRIWSIDSSLIYSTDEEGRTPLGLAASIGFVDGVCYILDKSVDSAYLRDRNGFYPIHRACATGHIEIIDAFLSRRPDSAELLNEQGENILHVAAKNGRAKLVSWMLKLSKLDMLINEKDQKGFTPLHWATLNCHPKVVSILTWDKRVNLEIMNNEGLTALDVAEKPISLNAPFRASLTRTALKSANAPRSEKAKTWGGMPMAGSMYGFMGVPGRERVNTLLWVATLVATVTFACGFTLPGGINNSDPNLGMATVVKKGAFQAFLICNTTALYSSILVAATLIWAQLWDPNLGIDTLRIAVPLLGVAFIAMSSAFISGVYLVAGNHRWLAILVLIMGSISMAILSVVFFLLCFPLSSKRLSSKRKILRYVMYYPIQLMILVTNSDMEKVIKA